MECSHQEDDNVGDEDAIDEEDDGLSAFLGSVQLATQLLYECCDQHPNISFAC